MVCLHLFFRTYMDDFAGVMMTDTQMVKLMEECNFCVPAPEIYKGQSIFWRKNSNPILHLPKLPPKPRKNSDPNPPTLPPKSSMHRSKTTKN